MSMGKELSLKLTVVDQGQEYICYADVDDKGFVNIREISPYFPEKELPEVKFSIEGNNVNIEVHTRGEGS